VSDMKNNSARFIVTFLLILFVGCQRLDVEDTPYRGISILNDSKEDIEVLIEGAEAKISHLIPAGKEIAFISRSDGISGFDIRVISGQTFIPEYSSSNAWSYHIKINENRKFAPPTRVGYHQNKLFYMKDNQVADVLMQTSFFDKGVMLSMQ